ncbi:hypothetical protein LTR78_006034 [Recurvomyces mirabilis]|uniref:Uncharacterized protein n=1 Tax=Recurvomyces mirabilis TaxID=574656 RepID=A0AAE0WM17_9PEZI|nr:hypothetical protein LTR78_006034 [Recurvomyces mirabilis]KAK5155155.1 hypothetical protein LTS14_006110 [Recurvomyces mirabilis]
MVKPLSFKGDKKAPKKRKRVAAENEDDTRPETKQIAQVEPEQEVDDNQWVSAGELSDISGPVAFVLPSSPPTSVSCDQLGKVFAQSIENLVEGLPDSAEPHDVRQVWIATRVVGSENNFTFKGHHGRYLGCDQYGICSATREAISQEETFKLSAVEGGAGLFNIETGHKKYLTLNEEKDSPEVRGDAEEMNENTALRVRMQARFKPQHKVDKAEKVRAKISRKELEEEVGRRLEDDEVKRLKRARRDGDYHEAMLDVKVKGKHDKFA